jgi:hypothetical protein
MVANFRQKIETKHDLTKETLQDLFSEAFAIAVEDAEFRDGEAAVALLEEMDVRSSQRALRVPVDSIQPKAVELPVEDMIASVRVQGIVDLLDIEGSHHRL